MNPFMQRSAWPMMLPQPNVAPQRQTNIPMMPMAAPQEQQASSDPSSIMGLLPMMMNRQQPNQMTGTAGLDPKTGINWNSGRYDPSTGVTWNMDRMEPKKGLLDLIGGMFR